MKEKKRDETTLLPNLQNPNSTISPKQKKVFFLGGGGTLPLNFNIPEDVNNKEVYIVGLILYQIYLIQ